MIVIYLVSKTDNYVTHIQSGLVYQGLDERLKEMSQLEDQNAAIKT